LVDLGIPATNIEVLVGDEAVKHLDSVGEGGWRQRLIRLTQFVTTDQSTDLIMYDAALHDGRAVIAVLLKDRTLKPAATRLLKEAGAHLLSFFGRIQTEEISRWQGPELIQPPFVPNRRSITRRP
jgi:hypothetical protein